MKVKTFEAEYELVEFNHYMDHNEEDSTSVVDVVVESDNIEFINNELNNIFIVDTGNLTYVFSGYEVNECYEVGDKLIRVVCVK